MEDKEYKSLDEIKQMLNKLKGFSEVQMILINSIAEKAYSCGFKRFNIKNDK